MMHLASYLPNWNSLDSVRRAHSDLEAAALVFFALLVVFDVLAHLSGKDKKRETLLEKFALCCFAVAVLAEIIAYPYGHRNDTLTEQVIGSLDNKARDAFAGASNALTKADAATAASGKAQEKADTATRTSGQAKTNAEAASRLADEAARNVSLTQALVSARYVADPDNLVSQLRPFKGLTLTVESYTGDAESHGLCTALLYFMQKAEMQPTDLCGRMLGTGQLLTDVAVSGPDDNIVLSLQQAVFRGGRFGVSTGPLGNAPKPSAYTVFVGVKPPFRIGPWVAAPPNQKTNKPEAKKP